MIVWKKRASSKGSPILLVVVGMFLLFNRSLQKKFPLSTQVSKAIYAWKIPKQAKNVKLRLRLHLSQSTSSDLNIIANRCVSSATELEQEVFVYRRMLIWNNYSWNTFEEGDYFDDMGLTECRPFAWSNYYSALVATLFSSTAKATRSHFFNDVVGTSR